MRQGVSPWNPSAERIFKMRSGNTAIKKQRADIPDGCSALWVGYGRQGCRMVINALLNPCVFSPWVAHLVNYKIWLKPPFRSTPRRTFFSDPVGEGLAPPARTISRRPRRAGACSRRIDRRRLNEAGDSRIDRLVGFNLNFIAYFFARTKK